MIGNGGYFMSEYLLTCCSTADMPLEYFKGRNIPFVCFHYQMDGIEYPDDLGQTMSLEDFYTRVESGAMPTTSQVNVGEFIVFFEPFLKAGQDILHISLSSGLSGSYQSAQMAREELLKKYPERKLLIVDSLGASSGYGLLVDTAADLRDRGEELEKTYDYLLEQRLYVHHWFFSTNLAHYKRGGRISATSAAVGTMLNMCPLMNVDNMGKLIPRAKIRGKKHVINEMVKKMEAHAQSGSQYSGKCFISHSACGEDAHALARLLEENFPKIKQAIHINNIGTVIGSHTGPGTVALFFYGDQRE